MAMLDDDLKEPEPSPTPPVVPEKIPLPIEPEPEGPATVENVESMAHEDAPGKIRLDDMKSNPSYSEAASSALKQKSVAASDIKAAIDRNDRNDSSNAAKNTDRGGEAMDVDAAEETSFSSSEMVDALPYQGSNARSSGLAPTMEEKEDEDSGRDSRSVLRKPGGPLSQDNHDKRSFAKRKENKDAQDREELPRLRQHVEDLNKRITALSTDKQIAEEKAERAAERVAEMKDLMNADLTDIERDTAALAEEVEKLKAENRVLREQLTDSQSHIFSLQPYRKDLTPEEVGREYDALVEQVQDWAQKFMEPWLDDHAEGVEVVMNHARKRPAEGMRFKKAMHQNPDLVHGSMFPETDEDIVTSIIMRYIHDNIFQTILYGAIANYIEVVSFIENNMQVSVEPKRDLFAVRTWTAEAYNALLSSPPFRGVRDRRRRELTAELAHTLKVFSKKDQFQWLCENLEEQCISPAMKLYEKLQVSTNHFYLDMNPYIVWGQGGELNTSPEFVESLAKLDCKNILQNRKAFNIAKLDPPPSKKELYHRLLNVCTVVPALYMRQIGQKDAIKEPVVVRKQQMLVAWGPEEKRQKFLENGDRPIASHLYQQKGERSGESWVPFRWG